MPLALCRWGLYWGAIGSLSQLSLARWWCCSCCRNIGNFSLLLKGSTQTEAPCIIVAQTFHQHRHTMTGYGLPVVGTCMWSARPRGDVQSVFVIAAFKETFPCCVAKQDGPLLSPQTGHLAAACAHHVLGLYAMPHLMQCVTSDT